MKHSFLRSAMLLLIMAFLHFQLHAIASEYLRIRVDKEARTLIAPESSHHIWHLNGERLLSNGRMVTLEESGVYSVTFEDENGNELTRSVQVSITDQGEIYVIHIIGDSTVANYRSGNYPMTGWGQVLKHFFNTSNVVINNRAIGGRSAKSFYNNHWSGVIEDVQAGDYVFVQFGINDAASDTARYSAPWEGFQDYLTLFVQETQAKGATCVLVATLRRNAWNDTDPPTLYDAYHDYPRATRALAQELNVPLIDLDQATVPLLTPLGRAYTGPFIYMNLKPGEYPNYPNGLGDNVHFQEMGAIEMARLVVEEIQEQAASFSVMNLLTPAIKPQYQVTVNKNNAEGGLVTRTQSFPSGVNVTLKAIPNDGYLFQGWQNAAGTIVSADLIYTFTMGSSSTSFTAVFSWDNNCAAITPYVQVDGGAWQQTADVSVSSGASVVLGPQPVSGGSWSWSGPGGFTAAIREITLDNIQTSQAGEYIATHTSSGGCIITQTFSVTVDGQSNASGSISLAASADNGAVNLSWTLSNITSPLQVMRDTDSDPAGRGRIAIVGNSTSTYTDTNVTNGTTYYYWIKAVDVNGNTVNSHAANATPTATGTSTITLQESTAGFCSVDGTVDSNNAGYTGAGFANTNNSSGNGIDWDVSGDGGEYTFRWRFANGSSVNRTATLYINGSAVSTIDFASTGSWTSWTTGEVVISGVASGSKAIRLEASQSSGLANIDYLEVGGPGVAATACSNSRTAVSRSIDAELSEKISLHPNPVNDILNIYLGGQQQATARIFDLSGKLILTKELTGTDNSIDMSGLPGGVYLLEAGNVRSRLIKE